MFHLRPWSTIMRGHFDMRVDHPSKMIPLTSPMIQSTLEFGTPPLTQVLTMDASNYDGPGEVGGSSNQSFCHINYLYQDLFATWLNNVEAFYSYLPDLVLLPGRRPRSLQFYCGSSKEFGFPWASSSFWTCQCCFQGLLLFSSGGWISVPWPVGTPPSHVETLGGSLLRLTILRSICAAHRLLMHNFHHAKWWWSFCRQCSQQEKDPLHPSIITAVSYLQHLW